MSLSQPSMGRSGLPRWLIERIWGLEHAFERARASGRAEDDTRLRIFFVLALFSLFFVTLAIGATRAAMFSDAARNLGFVAPVGASRADLVDRNGRMLAANLVHYGLYIDPREIWDQAETRRGLLQMLPDLDAARLQRALRGNRRVFVMGALDPGDRNRVHSLGLPGVSFEPEQHRVYPLGTTAAHIIGFSDSGGEGLAGAEAAFNEEIRAASVKGETIPLSIDLRTRSTRLWQSSHRAAPSASSPTCRPVKSWACPAGRFSIQTSRARPASTAAPIVPQLRSSRWVRPSRASPSPSASTQG